MIALWRKVSDYAITNGAQAISKKYDGGCTMFCLHADGEYAKHSEDECEVVVAATYPDAESMKSYLATGGLSDPKICNLHSECRTAWGRRSAEEAKRATADPARADERAAA